MPCTDEDRNSAEIFGDCSEAQLSAASESRIAADARQPGHTRCVYGCDKISDRELSGGS
jgi:hypothetical protein